MVKEFKGINEVMEEDESGELSDVEKLMFMDFYDEMKDFVKEFDEFENDDVEIYMEEVNKVFKIVFDFVKVFVDGIWLFEDIDILSCGKGDVFEF